VAAIAQVLSFLDVRPGPGEKRTDQRHNDRSKNAWTNTPGGNVAAASVAWFRESGYQPSRPDWDSRRGGRRRVASM